MPRLSVISLVLFLMGSGAALAQRDFSTVEIKVHPVAGKIYMLEGSGGNIGVSAGEDGLLIVDDQFAPLAEKIKAALAEINPGQLEFVLNTHWHGDHTGGNEVFGPEAPIIAHTNVRRRLSGDPEIAGNKADDVPSEAWPVITFDHSLSLHFNGEEIKVLHLAHSHTDGDSVIYFTRSNVIHMGDTFFNGRFPFVDLQSGGSVDGLISNIKHVLEKIPSDVQIIPGHGPLAGRSDLESYLQMLEETTSYVREKLAEGPSLDQLKQMGLPEKWQGWGEGFISADRWIETIYRSRLAQ